MFPPVHAGVGYLVYRGVRAVYDRGPPGTAALFAVVAGSVLPDLVDQPLYYALGLSSTRTLAHSLVAAVPVGLLALAVGRRSRRLAAAGPAFAVGYLAHPLADAVWPLVLWRPSELGFLLWPITHSPDYQGRKLLFTAGDVAVTTLWVELPILAIAVAVWLYEGAPGLPWGSSEK